MYFLVLALEPRRCWLCVWPAVNDVCSLQVRKKKNWHCILLCAECAAMRYGWAWWWLHDDDGSADEKWRKEITINNRRGMWNKRTNERTNARTTTQNALASDWKEKQELAKWKPHNSNGIQYFGRAKSQTTIFWIMVFYLVFRSRNNKKLLYYCDVVRVRRKRRAVDTPNSVLPHPVRFCILSFLPSFYYIYIYMLSLALFLCFSIFMPTFSARMIYCSELHAVGSSTILIYYFHACQYCQRPLFVLCGRNNVSAQQSTQFSALLRTLNAHSVFALHFDNSAKRRLILPIGWTAVAETVDPRRHSLRKIHFQPACMDDAMQKGYG